MVKAVHVELHKRQYLLMRSTTVSKAKEFLSSERIFATLVSIHTYRQVWIRTEVIFEAGPQDVNNKTMSAKKRSNMMQTFLFEGKITTNQLLDCNLLDCNLLIIFWSCSFLWWKPKEHNKNKERIKGKCLLWWETLLRPCITWACIWFITSLSFYWPEGNLMSSFVRFSLIEFSLLPTFNNWSKLTRSSFSWFHFLLAAILLVPVLCPPRNSFSASTKLLYPQISYPSTTNTFYTHSLKIQLWEGHCIVMIRPIIVPPKIPLFLHFHKYF